MNAIDKIYSKKQQHVVDFVFDEKVVDVFPDMIRRSVPGYETIVSLLGVVAEKYVMPNSRIYDLGCSLGASLLSISSRINDETIQFVGVDNSSEMLDKCKVNLGVAIPDTQLLLVQSDVQSADVKNASMVVMNFTLQFLPASDRSQMINAIYKGLLPGGVFVLSEKLRLENDLEGMQIMSLHEQFKSSNGYSELEISQKRTALENVMILDSQEAHFNRLRQAGFRTVFIWLQCLGFVSFLAIK